MQINTDNNLFLKQTDESYMLKGHRKVRLPMKLGQGCKLYITILEKEKWAPVLVLILLPDNMLYWVFFTPDLKTSSSQRSEASLIAF